MMDKMFMDFVKNCIFLLFLTSTSYQEEMEITPTSASRMEAFHNGSCGTYNQSIEGDCTFPDLFSEEKGKCKPFNEVDCGNRTEPLTPCEYTNSNCTRPQLNATLCVCDKDLDLNYDMCLSLTDGDYAWPARHWSPYFIQCKAKRTLPTTCEGHSVIYNFFENKCQVIYEVVNAAYSLSLSLSIPESLYHLLSFGPTLYVPQTTQEISPTFLNPIQESRMIEHSAQLVVESVMFTKTLYESAISEIPESESYNVLDRSSILATPPLTYGKLSSYNSAAATASITSADMASIYQQNFSKHVTISSYQIPNQLHPSTDTVEFFTSKLAPSSRDILSTKQIDILGPAISITNRLSAMNLHTSRESKYEHDKVTQSSLSPFPTASENLIRPVSTNQANTSLESLSSSDLLQYFTSRNPLIPSSKSVQTKSLFKTPKSSDSSSSAVAKLSASVHSAKESRTESTSYLDSSSSSSSLTSTAALSSSLHSRSGIKISTTNDLGSSSPTAALLSLQHSDTENMKASANNFDNSSPVTSTATLSSLVHSANESKIQTKTDFDSSTPLTSLTTLSSLADSNNEGDIRTTTSFLMPSQIKPEALLSSSVFQTKESNNEGDIRTTTSLLMPSQIKPEASKSSSVFQTKEHGIMITRSPTFSSPKPSSSFESLSNNRYSFGDSSLSVKEILSEAFVVSQTTTVNTKPSTLPPKQQAASESFLPHMISSSLSLQASAFSLSLFSSNSFVSTVSTVGTISPINMVTSSESATLKIMTVSPHFVSTSSIQQTTSYDSIGSIIKATSLTPTQDRSMKVSTETLVETLSLSSSLKQIVSNVTSSVKIDNHFSDLTSSTSTLLLYESYSRTVSGPSSPILYSTTKPESPETIGSKATVSPTLFLLTSKLPSETTVPAKPSKVHTENVIRRSTSREVLKASNSPTESFELTTSLSETVGKVSSELKVSLYPSRESGIILESSMLSISNIDTIISSLTPTSDLQYTLKPTLSHISKGINTLNTVVNFISDNSLLKPSLTVTKQSTLSLKPSQTLTERLTKSETASQSISSSKVVEQSVLFSHEHSTAKSPHQVTPTTNNPSDNSAERRKNTRTSIAIGAGVGGGILLICIILLIVIIVVRRKNKKGKRDFFQVRLPPELFMSRSL